MHLSLPPPAPPPLRFPVPPALLSSVSQSYLWLQKGEGGATRGPNQATGGPNGPRGVFMSGGTGGEFPFPLEEWGLGKGLLVSLHPLRQSLGGFYYKQFAGNKFDH